MEKLKNSPVAAEKRENKKLLKAILSQSFYFTLSFLFSGVNIAENLSPFATGFTGAVKEKYIISSSVGAALGYAVFFGLFGSLRFVAAVCLICILRLGIVDKAEKHKNILIASNTAVCTFLSSLVVISGTRGDFSYIIMCLCESMISGAFSLFSQKTQTIPALRQSGAVFSLSDIISSVFFGCIILLSLDRFTFFGFSVAKTIGFFVIMLFSLCLKGYSGTLTGVCLGLTLGFDEPSGLFLLSYTLSGLLSGITGVYGKIPTALALLVSNALSLILKGEAQNSFIFFLEAVFAAAVFLIIPEKYLYAITNPLSKKGLSSSETENINLNFALKRSAKAVKDISSSVNAVSELLQKADKPKPDNLHTFVKEDICKGCTKYGFCWEKCASLSLNAFKEANETVKKKGHIIKEDLPERLTLTCRLTDKISESFNASYCEYNARLVARQEIFEVKKAAAQQFFCLGNLLDEASSKLSQMPKNDLSLCAKLTPFFQNMGFSLLGINAFVSQNNKSTIQVYTKKVPVIHDISVLLERLYEITGNCYEKPVIDEYSNEGTVLSFTEERTFSVEYHVSSHTGANEEFCGDTLRCFFDGMGNFYAVLSDGMGSGSRAAIDSVMTSSLLSRLMRSGFSPERAIETVNCALLVKSAGETLSTVDILKIDLETGKCLFYKAGAAASIIQKGEKTLVVEKSSMPLGILKDTNFEKSEITLSGNDAVFIMSDGAATVPNVTFKEMILTNRTSTPKQLSEMFVNKALQMSVSGKHDDITVGCIVLKNS